MIGAAGQVLRTQTQNLVGRIQRSRNFVSAPQLGRQPESVCSFTQICVFGFAMTMENREINDNDTYA